MIILGDSYSGACFSSVCRCALLETSVLRDTMNAHDKLYWVYPSYFNFYKFWFELYGKDKWCVLTLSKILYCQSDILFLCVWNMNRPLNDIVFIDYNSFYHYFKGQQHIEDKMCNNYYLITFSICGYSSAILKMRHFRIGAKALIWKWIYFSSIHSSKNLFFFYVLYIFYEILVCTQKMLVQYFCATLNKYFLHSHQNGNRPYKI